MFLYVGDVFINWYVDDLHAKVISKDKFQEKGVKEEARSRLTKFGRLVCYMKLFLVEGTSISPKPEARDAYEAWTINIREMATLLQAKVNHFLNDIRQQSVAQNTAGKSRNRTRTMNFVATYQRLNHVTDISLFPRLTCDHVSDMATTPSELKTDIRVFRK